MVEAIMRLSDDEKIVLLQIARSSIQSALDGVTSPPVKSADEVFDVPCGAFATLRVDGELRGCVGYVEPGLSLLRTVREVSQKAAFEDPRFLPLSKEELQRTDIELSVLTPLEAVNSIDEIVVGTHGLVVDAGYRRGLLLPQVAAEFQWNREQFLEHTAVKAGLPPDAWKLAGVRIFRFTADKFSESGMAGTTS